MMDPHELKRLAPAALADLFVEAGITRKLAAKQLDPELGNKQFKTMANIYAELKSRGIEAQRSLLPLLHHSDPDVRCNPPRAVR
jgi:hypothetical protein